MKWVDYREKLGIGFKDDEKCKMLKNKVSLFLDEIGGYSDSEYREYSSMVGEYVGIFISTPLDGLKQSLIDRTTSLSEFVSKYIAFYNTYDEQGFYDMSTHQYYYSWQLTHDGFVSKKEVMDCFQTFLNELNIPFDVYKDEDGLFIFPKGVPEFDDALVSGPLQWLSAYPMAEKAWSKALREYAANEPQNASDVADKFRKALETFFQEFFGGSKTLENYKSEYYGEYLKQRNIPKEISGNLETILQAYTNYINNYAKHRDATSDKVLEYLMYQTGNIMRLLITLKQEETPDAD